jgi:ubiquinone/menaquinone biosynthesis C-methylase UbiE
MKHRAAPEHASPNLEKYTTQNALYRWHLDAFHEVLYRLMQQAAPRTVLDAGCGEGYVAHYLAERDRSLQVTGVDLSAGAIAYAQEHFGEAATFRTGSVLALPFSDNAFDLVLCSEVLEHLEAPADAVAQLKRVARRHVLITVPLEPYFRWVNNLGRVLGISPDPGHVQFWSRRGFEAFIRQHFAQATFAHKHYYQLALAGV